MNQRGGRVEEESIFCSFSDNNSISNAAVLKDPTYIEISIVKVIFEHVLDEIKLPECNRMEGVVCA